MSEIRKNLNFTTCEKALHYGYDFQNDCFVTERSSIFQWEELSDPQKLNSDRYSVNRPSQARSSVSTLASFDAEPSEEIPEILDYQLKISLERDPFSDHENLGERIAQKIFS